MATKNNYCVLGNAMNAGAMQLGEDISPVPFGIAITAILCLITIILF